MTKLFHCLLIVCVLAWAQVLRAEPPAPHLPKGWKFSLQPGDAAAGREAVRKLECYSCHRFHTGNFPEARSSAGVGPILAVLVGFVQGGTQALSRSLFGTMIPKTRSAEFFSFYDVSSKFAGIIGPFVFGLVGQLTGSSRLSVVALVIFFVGGGIILSTVNEKEGRARAAL